MTRKPIDLLVAVGAPLNRLPRPLAFVGGAATGLLVTDLAAPAPRATDDVDVIIDVRDYDEYQTVIRPALLALAAREDDADGAPLCRWVLQGVLVDVMPIDARVLGFSNTWYRNALATAVDHTLPDGTVIRVVDAPHFLATKIEAFLGRGRGDFMASKDIEDIVAIADGRPALHEDVRRAPPGLRAFLGDTLEAWLGQEAFRDALPGHLPSNFDLGRSRLVLERLRALVTLR